MVVLERARECTEAGLGDGRIVHLPGRAQDPARASYFGGRKPADGEIDWSKSPRQVRNLVRAVTRGVKVHILAKPPHSLKPDKLVRRRREKFLRMGQFAE